MQEEKIVSPETPISPESVKQQPPTKEELKRMSQLAKTIQMRMRVNLAGKNIRQLKKLMSRSSKSYPFYQQDIRNEMNRRINAKNPVTETKADEISDVITNGLAQITEESGL